MITVSIKTKPTIIANIAKNNAKDWPQSYRCNFLESGLVSYEDVKCGIAMLRDETIAKMAASFVGKPVTIDHQDVNPDNLEKFKEGVVTRVYKDGNWWWCDFILDTDESKEKVQNGYSVSCAYDVLEVGPGGEWHAIKYDEEIQNGQFTHLALVTNPRYEACRVYQNSKGIGKVTPESGSEKPINTEIKPMKFKFWAKKKENGKEIKTDFEKDPSLIFVTAKNNQKVSISDLIAKKKTNSVEDTLSLEDEFVDADGNKHSVSELLEAYNSVENGGETEEEKKNRLNAEKEEKEKKEKENAAKEEEEKKNAAKDTEEEKANGRKCSCNSKDDEEHEKDCRMSKKNGGPGGKKNSKQTQKKQGHDYYEKLATLRENKGAGAPLVQVETMTAKISRGNEMFGKKSE